MREEHKTWWEVKGKITARFGTVSACAATLGCSQDALRKAVEGSCPGVAARLKALLGFDWEHSEAAMEATA
jgi:hypothetical protein